MSKADEKYNWDMDILSMTQFDGNCCTSDEPIQKQIADEKANIAEMQMWEKDMADDESFYRAIGNEQAANYYRTEKLQWRESVQRAKCRLHSLREQLKNGVCKETMEIAVA